MIGKSTGLQALALLAIGSLLGYVAATTDRSRTADAAPLAHDPGPPAVDATRAEKASCCPSELDRGTILALAERNKTVAANAASAEKKPNILVIFGDDIGISNISAYSDGLLGYTTPNIDRVAQEGIRFLHYYGEQSCTAGRAAFITGQHGIRTGLTKVGFPGAPMGISQLDPTTAVLLKNLGYATGQFGKNHIGDRNETLPTVNGFDEFFGNLYHLNAEEEPELPDYPKDPEFKKKFGPRGVLRCKAIDRDDPTIDPRFGKVGKQTIEDSGALTKKRMETIDDETVAAAVDYIKRQSSAGTPFFCWYNSTRMHLRTHVKAENRGKYQQGDSEYIDGMIEHDQHVGQLLKALDDLEIADDTIVVYTTDNGPHANTWPDGATTPFRSEKNTNWEGAFRVPCLVRWPGVIKPGSITNEIMSHNDWLPTFCSIAGEPDIVNKLKAGYVANETTYKVHIDGYDQSGFLRGTSSKSARNKFFYTNDDGQLVALRVNQWKSVFLEQRAPGTLQVWAEPFTKLRLQKFYNLFSDPYERADITSNTYYDWWLNHAYLTYYGMDEVTKFAATFKEFPPRSIPPSFTPNAIMEGTLEELKHAQEESAKDSN
ncbi:arylsulfatase [Singulisphaera sp. Ch08]|uniref:Arylsulfatase n=1 Tax=Singulisphaera sp. Ch08 TaxID=3120278 RepID=A0AAU7CII9_9BACT